MIETERMRQRAADIGVSVSPQVCAKLDRYAEMLVEWNQKFNLTAITQPEEIENKHFIDCLVLAAQPELAGSVVDVGSGAGFPGLVLQLARSELAVTLMEPTGKRVGFLQAAAQELIIAPEIVKERAEEAARKQWRESFDIATARAVAPLPVLCEYCLPLVRVGGLFIAMKADAPEEVHAAASAISKLGGTLSKVYPYTLPDGAGRTLVFIQKNASTPPQYPRNGGKIKKTPL